MFKLNERYVMAQIVELIGTDKQKEHFEKYKTFKSAPMKKAILKELATMVKFEETKEGRKYYYLITEVFEEKQEKYDGRKENGKNTNFVLRKQNNKLFIQGITNFYKLAEEKGYIVLGEYIKNDVKVKVQCKNGHITEVYPTNLKINKGCKICKKN